MENSVRSRVKPNSTESQEKSFYLSIARPS